MISCGFHSRKETHAHIRTNLFRVPGLKGLNLQFPSENKLLLLPCACKFVSYNNLRDVTTTLVSVVCNSRSTPARRMRRRTPARTSSSVWSSTTVPWILDTTRATCGNQHVVSGDADDNDVTFTSTAVADSVVRWRCCRAAAHWTAPKHLIEIECSSVSLR